MILLCRNRLKDYEHWRRIFDLNLAEASAAGLTLIHCWRDVDDPCLVFFIFAVKDKERAQAFMEDPNSAKVGDEAGVLDGECHFLEERT